MRTLEPVFTFGAQTFLGVDAIRSFETTRPSIRIKVSEYPDDQVDALMRDGKASLGVLAGPIDSTFFDVRFLASIRHVAIVPETHPIAVRESISYADLDGETIILVGRRFRPYHNNMGRLARARAVPERVIEVGEINKVSQFASQGVGIGISVEFEATDHPFPNTRILPFSEADCLWDLYVVHQAGRLLDPIELEFVEHLVKCARNA